MVIASMFNSLICGQSLWVLEDGSALRIVTADDDSRTLGVDVYFEH